MLKDLIARQMVRRTKTRRFPESYLEQKHVDLSLAYPNDSSFFYGGDKDGSAFISRMAFRGPSRPSEWWLDFFLPGRGSFGLRQHPGPEGAGFQLGSLKWEPVEIGKVWRVTYEGPVPVIDEGGAAHACRIDLTFTGEHPLYDFGQSSDHRAIARAIAAERWTADFFRQLKELSQVHIEQTGRLEGTITLDGEVVPLNLRSMRDHSFGSRSWHSWDRHYWMSGLAESGWRWTVTTIRYDFIRRLVAGFVISPEGGVDAVVECTDLETVFREALLPDRGLVEIHTRGGRLHKLEFQRNGHFPYVQDGVYAMSEGIGSYRFDGVDGLGMVEIGFKKSRYEV